MHIPKRTSLGIAGGILLLGLAWTICPASAQAAFTCLKPEHSAACLQRCLSRTLVPLGKQRQEQAPQAESLASARLRLSRAMAGLLDTDADDTAYRRAFTEYQAAREHLRALGDQPF